jgi:hypothetical protein
MLRLIDGRTRTLPGVLYIVGLARNLISIRKMDGAEVKIVFEKETCRMVRGTMALLKEFGLELCISCKEALLMVGVIVPLFLILELKKKKLLQSLEKKVMLWHQRLRHIREKGLQLLHGKGMVEGMYNCSLDFDFCEHCVYEKHNRVRFSFGATREGIILQLVHSDVLGPVSVPSLGKYVYYVSCIDDFSRNTWIYFLRKKSEVFDMFKEFKSFFENQTEKIIMVLRIDNGREFCGNEFEELCKKCSLSKWKNTPYTT